MQVFHVSAEFTTGIFTPNFFFFIFLILSLPTKISFLLFVFISKNLHWVSFFSSLPWNPCRVTNGIKTIRSSLAFLVSIVHDLDRGAEWRSLYRIRTIFILAERSSGKMFLWGDKTQGIQVPVRVQPSVRLDVHHVVTPMIHFSSLRKF